MDVQNIANWATILGGPIALIAVIFSAITFYLNKKHDKRKDTLDAYNRLQSEAFDDLYTKYPKAKIAEIVANYRKTEYKDQYYQLGLYLARIEHFCVGVKQDIYDWKTLYELAHGFFDRTIRYRISPLVDRKETFTEEELYANLKYVWQRMDEETEKRKQKREKEKNDADTQQ